jgi:hypothetical protein
MTGELNIFVILVLCLHSQRKPRREKKEHEHIIFCIKTEKPGHNEKNKMHFISVYLLFSRSGFLQITAFEPIKKTAVAAYSSIDKRVAGDVIIKWCGKLFS